MNAEKLYAVKVLFVLENGLVGFNNLDDAMQAVSYYWSDECYPHPYLFCDGRFWAFTSWYPEDWGETACEFHNAWTRAMFNGPSCYSKPTEEFDLCQS